MPELYSIEKIAEYLEDRDYELVEISQEYITIRKLFSGREVEVMGKLTPRFPFDLPDFYILNRLHYGHLAHIGWRKNPIEKKDDIGLICKGVSIARSINYEAPELVFEYGLLAAFDLLGKIFESDEYNDKEILAEFSGHWRFHCDDRKIRHVVLAGECEAPEVLWVHRNSANSLVYLPKEAVTNEGYGLGSFKGHPESKGLFIPIETPVLPPAPEKCVLEWWHSDVLPRLSSDVCDFIERKCRHHTDKKSSFRVVFRIATTDSRYSWAGFSLTHKKQFSYKKKNPPPLFGGASAAGWKVETFDVQIHNQEYLLPRGGAGTNLSSEKLLLVGAGSLGGEISKQLAYAGVGQIDLLDFDTFETNNIYRHVLPSAYVGFDKATGLKYRLEHQFPYLEIEKYGKHQELKDLTLDGNLSRHLSQYDGVILATGDVAQERHFNEVVKGLKEKPWLIFTWLEGYGVGGHAVYVKPDGEGCLSCLFRDPESGLHSLSNIQNFLSVDQDFAVDLSGCGTHFLPYSYVDVVETASLVMRVLEHVYANEVTESIRVSWKGTDRHARANGLTLTGRWKRFNKDREFIPLVWNECATCGDSDDI